MTLQLSDDIWVHIGLHLKPRHLSKLMRTCKRINRLVDNETYWTRIVAHLALRDSWLVDIGPPHGERLPYSEFLPKEDPSMYFMVGLDQSYYQSMQRFIQRIPDTINTSMQEGDEHDQAWARKAHGLTLWELTMDHAMEKWLPIGHGMKAFAKEATIQYWVTDKTDKYKEKWPKIQKFLIDMEDDPMPVVYKRRFFRKMWDAFGESLMIFNALDDEPFIAEDICIF